MKKKVLWESASIIRKVLSGLLNDRGYYFNTNTFIVLTSHADFLIFIFGITIDYSFPSSYIVLYLLLRSWYLYYISFSCRPEQLTKEVWDFIFFEDAPEPATDIELSTLRYVLIFKFYWLHSNLFVLINESLSLLVCQGFSILTSNEVSLLSSMVSFFWNFFIMIQFKHTNVNLSKTR